MKNKVKEYKTLEIDLINVFQKRNIEVEEIIVSKGVALYTIKVKR